VGIHQSPDAFVRHLGFNPILKGRQQTTESLELQNVVEDEGEPQVHEGEGGVAVF
jgi:hypothetical protein